MTKKQPYTDYSQCIPDTSGGTTAPSATSTSVGSIPTIIADANYWFSLWVYFSLVFFFVVLM